MKKLYFISLIGVAIVFIFWLIYTIIFTFIYGWHWKAISPIEELFDLIASVLFYVCKTGFIVSIIILADKIMETY